MLLTAPPQPHGALAHEGLNLAGTQALKARGVRVVREVGEQVGSAPPVRPDGVLGKPTEVDQLLRVHGQQPLARRGWSWRWGAQHACGLQVAGQRADQTAQDGAASRPVRPAGLQHRGIKFGHVLDAVALELLLDVDKRAQHGPYRRWSIVALGQPPHKVVDPRPEHGQGGVTVIGSRAHRCKHQNRLLRVVPGVAQVPMLLVHDLYV